MNKSQRIKNILEGVLLILTAAAMAAFPQDSSTLVILILSFSLLVHAVNKLIYYFTMARHMIGGSMILCNGLILLDFAFLVISLGNVPQAYVMLYLITGLLFSGVVDILNAVESKKLCAPSWKFKMAEGIISLVLSITCFIFFKSPKMVVYVFCLNLVQSAVLRISEACRKTAIIYIQ